jgi:hypothetical protein
MKLIIDFWDQHFFGQCSWSIGGAPSFPECYESVSLTVVAWPMSCGKRNRFVEEEQLRVAEFRLNLKHRSLDAIKLHSATYPRFAFPLTNDFLLLVVKDSAIAHACRRA